jgi:hypothetical protein
MSNPAGENDERSYERYLDGFDPTHRPPRELPDADVRSMNALEYAAYQLGQMNRKLDRLIAALETKKS